MYVAKTFQYEMFCVTVPVFSFRERPCEKNIALRGNAVCTILEKSKGLLAFLLSLSHKGTFCNDPTFQHSAATELEITYRLDLSDGYVDENKVQVCLKEEQINTARHIHKL